MSDHENGPTSAEMAMAQKIARIRARVEELDRACAAAQAVLDEVKQEASSHSRSPRETTP